MGRALMGFAAAGFNGATDLSRWKGVLYLYTDPIKAPLQWGHRPEPVESP